ncbi:MAG: DNA repair protein RecO, partial [Planctomycetes bacterium]|nr:DNA repair protein RecO [Planctomycetota bacterium]
MSEQSDPLPRLYGLLVEFLKTLTDAESTDTLALAFALQVLAQVGYGPELNRCVGCGSALAGRRLKLSARMGGFACPGCEGSAGRLVVVSAGAGAALRNFLLAPLKAVANVHLSRTMKKECFAAVGALLVEVVGAPLRTWSLVQPRV